MTSENHGSRMFRENHCQSVKPSLIVFRFWFVFRSEVRAASVRFRCRRRWTASSSTQMKSLVPPSALTRRTSNPLHIYIYILLLKRQAPTGLGHPPLLGPLASLQKPGPFCQPGTYWMVGMVHGSFEASCGEKQPDVEHDVTYMLN